MIELEYARYDEINISRKEVLRYLGYGKNNADDGTLAMIEKCICEIRPKLSCRACYDRFPVSADKNSILNLGFTSSSSESLAKNLKGCSEIILFTATTGFDVDRIIQRYSVTSPAYAVTAQAVGTAAIENWCNILCDRFSKREIVNGRYLRPRFSPGYGDFPIETQRAIINVLDCNRKIGVSLTESMLMTPSKSVSAVIGVSRSNLHCPLYGCETCNNSECEFRRS